MVGKEPDVSTLTRRQVVVALAIAAPAMGQTPAPPPSPVPPEGVPAATPPAMTAQTRRQKADEQIRKASEALRNVKVPMDLEPAFRFLPST